MEYTKEELNEALRAVSSIIHKCEKAQEKFPNGTSHHTLLHNRLRAMYISKSLIEQALHNKSSIVGEGNVIAVQLPRDKEKDE